MMEAKTLDGPTGRAGTLPFRGAIRSVLCPMDLTAASDAAFSHARMIAETFGAELTLYHSIDLRRVPRGPGLLAESIRRTELAAIRHLETCAAQTSAVTQIAIDYGLAPHRAVAAAIAARRPDLTVMATHGRRGIAHLLSGSVAETAVEEGGRPILCVRRGYHGPAVPYRRILLPTDLQGRAAFPLASLLAWAFVAEVVALHCVPFSRASFSGLPGAATAERPDAGDVARFLGPDLARVTVHPRVDVGPGWEAIPRVAAEENCDLVVLSTHRHDTLGDSLLGSHAERIAAVSPCPVIVV